MGIYMQLYSPEGLVFGKDGPMSGKYVKSGCVCYNVFPYLFSHVSIKSDCREITKEVCTNTPKTVSKTVPITSCHLKQSVACEKVVKKIPKQECENVETEVQK